MAEVMAVARAAYQHCDCRSDGPVC